MNSRSPRAIVRLLLAALALAPAAPAGAAGFALFEQGARGMGFAGAYVAQTQDASALFHNAAGIAFLRGKNVYFGATLIAPSADFTGANPFPGEAVTEEGDAGVMIPFSVDYSQQISERLTVGLGVHIPYGLRTRWLNRDTTYSGRYISKRAEIAGFSINPSLAYKLADRFAVGAGFDFRMASIELDRNVAGINPFTQQVVDAATVALNSETATGYGFNVGVLAQPIDNLSVGVAYRHKVAMDFQGDAVFSLQPTGNAQLDVAIARSLPNGATKVESRIEFPSLWSVGAEYRWNTWTVAAQIDFHGWSSFDEVPLTFTDHPELSSVIEESYENSRIYRVGAEWRLSETWDLRGGYFYDESPAPVEAVSPLLPDADRHGVALGATLRLGRLRIDAANWLLFFAERSTEGRNRDNYNGTYKNFAELFSVSFGYSF
jgi:long-chain fatty acid transport protein